MKKSILLFLPALLFLSSCNSNLMIHTPEEVVEVVNSFTSATYSIYNYTITGNALGIEANRTSNDNVFIDDTYYEGETPTTYSSRMLSLPFNIGGDDFYITNENGNVNSGCEYYSIYSKLVNTAGSITEMQTEFTSNGGIRFFSRNSDVTLTISSIYASAITVNARFDIDIVYDNNGYLVSETVKSTNIGKQPYQYQIDLNCTYTYE